MKVTIELEGSVVTLSDESVYAYDGLAMCCRALIAVGFHQDNISEAIADMNDYYEAQNKTCSE